MMKILLTGGTKLQQHPPEERRASGTVKIDVPAAVVAGLRRLGHEVDWRPVTIGEDLSRYDLVWASLACPMSTNGAPGALGTFWALSRNLPAVLFMDDWRATRVGHSQARSLLRDPEKYFFRTMLAPKEFREMCGNLEGATYSYRNALVEAGAAMERQRARLLEAGNEKGARYISISQVYPDDHELILKHLDSLTVGLQRSYDVTYMTRRVIPMYRWGDPDSVRPFIAPTVAASDAPLYKLDPSHVVEEIVRAATLAPVEERQLAWALPLITPPAEFIARHAPDTSWPIDTVGHRTSAVKKLPTEVDVLEWVSRRSGVFAPCYFGDGRKTKPLTGWWRSRYLYAAAAKLPLVAFKGEASPLGEPYTRTYKEVEAMTGPERLGLAHRQSDALRPHYADRNTFDQMLEEIVGE